jgi:hypothetical protein
MEEFRLIDRNTSNFLLENSRAGRGGDEMRIEESAPVIPVTGIAKGT